MEEKLAKSVAGSPNDILVILAEILAPKWQEIGAVIHDFRSLTNSPSDPSSTRQDNPRWLFGQWLIGPAQRGGRSVEGGAAPEQATAAFGWVSKTPPTLRLRRAGATRDVKGKLEFCRPT